MISKKILHTIDDIQTIQYLATKCPMDVALHSPDSKIMIDAKSYIGMYALDFSKPILIVSEDEDFHEMIRHIGENVE